MRPRTRGVDAGVDACRSAIESAVGVADQDGALDARRVEELTQVDQPLVVHVGERARQVHRIGSAVPGPAVDKRTVAGRLGQRGRKVAHIAAQPSPSWRKTSVGASRGPGPCHTTSRRVPPATSESTAQSWHGPGRQVRRIWRIHCRVDARDRAQALLPSYLWTWSESTLTPSRQRTLMARISLPSGPMPPLNERTPHWVQKKWCSFILLNW